MAMGFQWSELPNQLGQTIQNSNDFQQAASVYEVMAEEAFKDIFRTSHLYETDFAGEDLLHQRVSLQIYYRCYCLMFTPSLLVLL